MNRLFVYKRTYSKTEWKYWTTEPD